MDGSHGGLYVSEWKEQTCNDCKVWIGPLVRHANSESSFCRNNLSFAVSVGQWGSRSIAHISSTIKYITMT